MTTIGFIGLGHMGNPIVKNLLKAGHRVHVFDLSKAAISALEKAGASACASVSEVAKNAEVVFTMLQTGEQVLSCCLGKDGIFANIDKNALYIDLSSIDIKDSRALQQKAATIHLSMVDAPVSGGVKGAEAAALTIMVGGTKEAFAKAKPFLDIIGKNIIHAGKAGCGQAAKICNNMILGVSMIAVSEAFALAEKLELDPKKLFDISSNASGQCWAMTSYCPYPGIMENVPANNDYRPGFTANMMLKDLNLSQAAARSVNAKTPIGQAATAIYQKFASENKNGELDFSGIIKLFNV